MAKHRVKVTLRAECEVYVDVEAAEDEEPTHLTKEEQEAAIAQGDSWPQWEIERVRLA